jgi:hypothetical protein
MRLLRNPYALAVSGQELSLYFGRRPSLKFINGRNTFRLYFRSYCGFDFMEKGDTVSFVDFVPDNNTFRFSPLNETFSRIDCVVIFNGFTSSLAGACCLRLPMLYHST